MEKSKAQEKERLSLGFLLATIGFPTWGSSSMSPRTADRE